MDGIRCIRLWRPENEASVLHAAQDAFITEVDEPELHVFPALENKNTGIAAVVCPGGGYGGLALGAEGHLCASWLASMGVTGLVLQYRLPHGDKTVPLEDIRSAMAYARQNAPSLGIAGDRLGVIGFSAGGHLAALASTAFGAVPANTRPDFTVLFYPVISMEKRKRGATRPNLLGRHPTQEDIDACSCHLRVTGHTPPALLFHCDDDPLVPPRHSLLYYQALKQHNIDASLHIFPEGGHAWGFRNVNPEGTHFLYGNSVRALLYDWLLRAARGGSR